MLRSAYILSSRDDWIWFVSLPFLAVLIGIASQQWLSVVAVASFSLWVTAPHHFATWLRAFGVPEDRRRFRTPLTIGPIVLIPLIAAGLVWAPMTLLFVVFVWDHQHSIMQQYGFSRIYDHKARTGSRVTPRLDLGLNWVLYGNLLIVSPLYADFWVRELFRFGVPVDETVIASIQQASWAVTSIFVVGYAVHLLIGSYRGVAINPVKYLFIGSSYFMWYSTAWWMDSIVAAKIAHSIMHGVQYIVLVHSTLGRRMFPSGTFATWITRSGNVAGFVAICFFYALAHQMLTLQPIETFGFGLFDFGLDWNPIRPRTDASAVDKEAYALFAGLVVHSTALVHYYYDAFIWRVSDRGVQRGL